MTSRLIGGGMPMSERQQLALIKQIEQSASTSSSTSDNQTSAAAAANTAEPGEDSHLNTTQGQY